MHLTTQNTLPNSANALRTNSPNGAYISLVNNNRQAHLRENNTNARQLAESNLDITDVLEASRK